MRVGRCRGHASSVSRTLLCFLLSVRTALLAFFFFNDTATTEIYTLSLHDALPILADWKGQKLRETGIVALWRPFSVSLDRKSTRLNSSHQIISYAVFCLKKKKRAHRIGDKLADQCVRCPPVGVAWRGTHSHNAH